jgi:ubiquinone/menaquinone biosynthesis C-methylase UbiE
MVDFVILSEHELCSEFSQGIIAGTVYDISLHFIAFDIEVEMFPHDDNPFEGVIMSNALETLSRGSDAVLTDIYRILKRDSWLVSTTPNSAY